MQLEELYVMRFQSRPKGLLYVPHVAAAATCMLTGTLDCSGCCCICCRKQENLQMGGTGI